jgi:flagellum-specific peptidoglycan hydrolase FlgJ
MSVRTDYIATYSQDMIDACAGTGLFPSVMMAQAILEGNAGQSVLAKKYNNHFGIKCLCKACPCYLLGERVYMGTSEEINNQNQSIQDWFRTYKTPFDSFVDRVHFLKVENPRYAKAGVFKASTPQEQTQALLDAQYATEHDYASQLNGLIATYNLEFMDVAPANTTRMTTNTKYYLGIAGAMFVISGIAAYYFLYRKAS